MSFAKSLCTICARRNLEDPKACEAFPDGIPSDIARGLVAHTEPYPGDNGFMFVPREGVTDEEIEYYSTPFEDPPMPATRPEGM